MSFDWTILRWIQTALVCPALDILMPKITLLGNGGAVWLLAAGVLLAAKKYRKYGVFLLAGLAVGVLLGNLTLKPLIARPRPCWLFTITYYLFPIWLSYLWHTEKTGYPVSGIPCFAVFTCSGSDRGR